MNANPAQPVLCPYCGLTQPETDRCSDCGGRFDVLSRQATQNAMGPWFIRDEGQPFRPGFSYDTLKKMVQRGRVTGDTIVRGPTSHQFWMHASEIPGLAHLVGRCHACGEVVAPEDVCCEYCGVPFGAVSVREALGLLPQRDVQAMTPVANHATEIAQAPTDAVLTSVGYERLQAAIAKTAPSQGARSSHHPTAADLAAIVEEDPPLALDGIRPPRQKRQVRDYIDPQELAALEEQQRQQRMRLMKITISVVMILAIAAMLVVLLWKVGVFDQLRATAPDSNQDTGAKPAKVELEQPIESPNTDALAGVDEQSPSDSSLAVEPVKTVDDWIGDYDQAILVISSDSLDELQKARAVIMAVQKNVPDDRIPSDLIESLARINRQIEKIKLREMIDDGGI